MRRIMIIMLIALALGAGSSESAESGGHKYRVRKLIGELPQGEAQPSFAFAPISNQPLSTLVESEEISLGGLEESVQASISGPPGALAELSTDGGLTWSEIAAVDGTSRLRLRMVTSATPGTIVVSTIQIGSYSTTWTTTTQGGGAPVLSFFSAPVTDAFEGMPYDYNIMADSTKADDVLTISLLVPAMPHAWLGFVDYGDWTAELSGTPPAGSGSPVAPSFTSSPGLVAQTGLPYAYDFSLDTANNLVDVAMVAGPEWLAVRKEWSGLANDAGKWMLSGVPPVETFAAPSFGSFPGLSAEVGMPYEYDFSLETEGNLLLVEKAAGPEWLAVRNAWSGLANDAEKWMLSGVPRADVPPANTDPRFTSVPPSATIAAGSNFSHVATVTDDNPADALVIEAVSLPAWLSFSYAGNHLRTASISGTNAPPGTHDVSLRVRDGDNAAAIQNFSITVE